MAHHEHHITPFSTYLKVLLVLLVLTIFTVVISGFHLGPITMLVAMLVASIKAMIVLAYFMHLKDDSNMNRVMFFAGVFFLLIMFAFSYGDIITRIDQLNTL
jgi:cytochrome c oxidase subunit IV